MLWTHPSDPLRCVSQGRVRRITQGARSSDLLSFSGKSRAVDPKDPEPLRGIRQARVRRFTYSQLYQWKEKTLWIHP